MTLTHEPSRILKDYMVGQGMFNFPYGGNWPLWTSFLPEETPNDAVAIYDDIPQLDGRRMESGEIQQHFGILLYLRCENYDEGYIKMLNTLETLSAVVRQNIIVEASTYTINAISNRSGVVSNGVEPGTKRRHFFSMNLIISLTEN